MFIGLVANTNPNVTSGSKIQATANVIRLFLRILFLFIFYESNVRVLAVARFGADSQEPLVRNYSSIDICDGLFLLQIILTSVPVENPASLVRICPVY